MIDQSMLTRAHAFQPLIYSVCLSGSEALSANYLEILKVCCTSSVDFGLTKQTQAHDQYLHTLLDRNRLDAIFKKMGADVNCLTSDAQIAPNFNASAASDSLLPRSFKSAVRLLQEAAPW
jgi:hypothetical protein